MKKRPQLSRFLSLVKVAGIFSVAFAQAPAICEETQNIMESLDSISKDSVLENISPTPDLSFAGNTHTPTVEDSFVKLNLERFQYPKLPKDSDFHYYLASEDYLLPLVFALTEPTTLGKYHPAFVNTPSLTNHFATKTAKLSLQKQNSDAHLMCFSPESEANIFEVSLNDPKPLPLEETSQSNVFLTSQSVELETAFNSIEADPIDRKTINRHYHGFDNFEKNYSPALKSKNSADFAFSSNSLAPTAVSFSFYEDYNCVYNYSLLAQEQLTIECSKTLFEKRNSPSNISIQAPISMIAADDAVSKKKFIFTTNMEIGFIGYFADPYSSFKSFYDEENLPAQLVQDLKELFVREASHSIALASHDESTLKPFSIQNPIISFELKEAPDAWHSKLPFEYNFNLEDHGLYVALSKFNSRPLHTTSPVASRDDYYLVPDFENTKYDHLAHYQFLINFYNQPVETPVGHFADPCHIPILLFTSELTLHPEKQLPGAYLEQEEAFEYIAKKALSTEVDTFSSFDKALFGCAIDYERSTFLDENWVDTNYKPRLDSVDGVFTVWNPVPFKKYYTAPPKKYGKLAALIHEKRAIIPSPLDFTKHYMSAVFDNQDPGFAYISKTMTLAKALPLNFRKPSHEAEDYLRGKDLFLEDLEVSTHYEWKYDKALDFAKCSAPAPTTPQSPELIPPTIKLDTVHSVDFAFTSKLEEALSFKQSLSHEHNPKLCELFPLDEEGHSFLAYQDDFKPNLKEHDIILSKLQKKSLIASFSTQDIASDLALSSPVIEEKTPTTTAFAATQHLRLACESLSKLPTLRELNTHTLTDELDISVEYAKCPDKSGYQFAITMEPAVKNLFGRPAQNFIFLIDRSGSIDRNRFNVFKQAVTRSLAYLKEGDQFNIVMFDSEATKMSNQSVYFSASSKHAAKRFMEQQKRGQKYSLPNIYALLLKTHELAKRSNLPTSVILVTNGKSLEDLSSHSAELGRLISTNKNDFNLYCACASNHNNTIMLEILSHLNKGECLHSQTHAAFPRKLASLVKHAGNIMANAVNIHNLSSNRHIVFYPTSNAAPNMYLDKPYTIYGYTDSLQDFDLIVQGRLKDQWLNIKKRISFKGAKTSARALNKDLAFYTAYDKYREYLNEGNTAALETAEELLEPFFHSSMF